MLVIANGITGCGELKSDCSRNITGINLVKLCSLVCMHLKDTSYTFLFILCGIKYVGTGVHGSGVNTEICQFSYERVRHNLECKCGERFFIGRMSLGLIALKVNTLDCRDVNR